MKKCPFCAEDIQDEAIKCRYCGEFLDGRRSTPAKPGWADSYWTLTIAVAMLGPFAIPMIWRNARLTLPAKATLTVAVLALTWFLVHRLELAMQHYFDQIDELMRP